MLLSWKRKSANFLWCIDMEYGVNNRKLDMLWAHFTCVCIIIFHICMHPLVVRQTDVHLCAGYYHSSMANVCAQNHTLPILKGKKSRLFFCTFSFSFEIIWATFDEKKHKKKHPAIVSRFFLMCVTCAFVYYKFNERKLILVFFCFVVLVWCVY